ncbi:6-bladed beta-propeller [Calderihabitans maritimus]|uniref:NHL repeat containing protein n=1 Tax=Calderihabitans maritimus TaxID=1246530 RepID=A0A1Z5HW04_9FIRM|nr:6-bladed beta-propeller [Calderihabitans maritimus]GAW93588.1 NHL repeat containing protein [Calderihabitans maritimus]
MRVTTLVIIILVIALAGTITFGVFYLTKEDPIEKVRAIVPPVVEENNPPEFRFAFYGDAEKNVLLEKPLDAAVAGGKIYVTDSRNHRILVFDYNGKLVNAFGEDYLKTPYGVAVSGSRVYVSDAAASRIVIFNRDGKFEGYFEPKKEGKQFHPRDKYAIAPVGDLQVKGGKIYVSLIKSDRVLVFDLKGNLQLEIGEAGVGAGEFRAPHGLAVDDEGNIYVADSGNNRIQVFGPDGRYLKTLGGEEGQMGKLTTVRGVALDQRGNIYAVMNLTNKVVVFGKDGKALFQFGSPGAEHGQLGLPNGIFIDSNGRIYVVEMGNHRVSVFGY